MRQQTVKKFVALAASLAIVGCVAPGPLKTLDPSRPAATAAARQGAGTIALSVNWPDFRAYGTQAIPNRATRVVVSLTHTDGSPVRDLNGAVITPVTAERGGSDYLDTYGKFSWELAQQEGIEIAAELFDAAGKSLATTKRVVDVIAGFRSTVVMDLVLPDAPTLTSISSPSFRVGDTLVLTGSHFGATTGWQARVYLQEEYSYGEEESPFDDNGPRSYSPPVYLPDEYVTINSDTQITVTIPEQIREGYRQGNLTDMFWGYFNGQNSRLTLGVNVDGVNSPRIEVAMPKEVGAKATITLEQGFNAPPHRSDDQRYKTFDLTDATFSIPTASGTEWTFELTGNDYYYNRQKKTIRLTDTTGNALFREEWEYGTPYESYDNLDKPYNNGGYSPAWEFQFLRRIDAMGVELLPDQDVVLPPGVPLPEGASVRAKHLAYSTSNGALCDLWVIPNLGPVRMRRIEVYGDQGRLWRNVREYRLIGFKPAPATQK